MYVYLRGRGGGVGGGSWAHFSALLTHACTILYVYVYTSAVCNVKYIQRSFKGMEKWSLKKKWIIS